MKIFRAGSIILITLIALTLMTTGCQDKKSKPVIGVSLLSFKNEFFKVIGDNIKTEAAKHGYDVNVLDAQDDQARQSDQIRDFIQQGVAAIVLSPVKAKSAATAIREANKAGIPVFTVDIPCDEPDTEIVAQVATDNYLGGKLAGQAMVEVLGESGGDVVIIHKKDAASCILRVQGFEEVIQKHNKSGKPKITVVQTLEGKGEDSLSTKVAADAIETYPNLRGMFCINDPSALGAWGAVDSKKKNKQITIISFDGQPRGKRAIKEGKIYAEPIQYPTQMGIKVVQAIVAHSNGKTVTKNQLIPPTLYRKSDADKDPNIDQWQ